MTTPRPASIIDGNALSAQLRADVMRRADALKAQGITPGLAVLLVGENPASQVYVRNKVKACAEAGLHSVLERYDADMTEAALLARIDALNKDPAIHGILVQLPVPQHIDANKVIEAIAPEKDVDGFHIASAGALMVGQPGFLPCTPYGCMKMLESIGYDLRGKHAVVIGRSNIVGKPMAMLLLQKNATVTICHSGTKDLKAMTLQADVIVAAVGKVNVLTADMVKPGAVVIDVGMNRNAEGKLCGDVDYAGAWRRRPHDHHHAAGQHPGICGAFSMNKNPLLGTDKLPRFDAIAPEHVEPAIEALLALSQTALATVTAPAFPAQWLALSATLDVAVENLGVAWGAVSHLNSVNDSPALRAAYNAALPKVTDFFTRLGADEKLYAKYKAVDVASLNVEQKQAHKTPSATSCWAAQN